MIVKLLTTTEESNKVDKQYTEDMVITGELKDDCSILNPIILFELDEIPTSNYAYIDDFKRFYFIDDIVVVRDRLYRISMSIDVLMSFKDSIRELVCVIKRQENKYNLYINDPQISSFEYQQVQTKTFPSGFSDDVHFILAVNGNYVSTQMKETSLDGSNSENINKNEVDDTTTSEQQGDGA